MGKWISCKQCGHSFYSSLSKCPECGKTVITFKKVITIAGTVFVLGIVAVGVILGFNDDNAVEMPDSDKNESQSVVSENKSSIIQSSENDSDNYTSSDTGGNQPADSAVGATADNSSKNSSTTKPESGDAAASNQTAVSPELPIIPTIGTVLEGGKAYVTLPEYYLRAMHKILSRAGEIDFNEFAYSMTDEEKQQGVLYIVKNADGSATSVLTESYYLKLRTESQKQCKAIAEQLKSYDFVERVEYSNDFEGVILLLTVNSVSEQENDLLVAAGITFLYNQYLIPYSENSCVIEIVYEDKEKEKINFPKLLK